MESEFRRRVREGDGDEPSPAPIPKPAAAGRQMKHRTGIPPPSADESKQGENQSFLQSLRRRLVLAVRRRRSDAQRRRGRNLVVAAAICQLALRLPGDERAPDSSPADRSGREKVRVFYNLFIKGPEDAARVLDMYREQTRFLDPDLHDDDVYVSSIGFNASGISDLKVARHYPEGGEDVTLHSLWEFCRSSPRSKVVYLHSKGSFHPDESNDRLRRFITEGALSGECANLPDDCDVCSSRMSSHPHPHTSGNMWLARCEYVARLRDPYDLKEERLPKEFKNDDGCRGYGRYFLEHWVHSHPSVRPCDLYPGMEYTWAYENVPDGNFTKELKRAPRFGFDAFVSLLLKSFWYCRKDKSMNTIPGYIRNRKWSYGKLYNITTLDESWYLWQYLNMSGGDGKGTVKAS